MGQSEAPCIIVGAGQAGARAADAIRAESKDMPITLVGAEEELPYERPPLSKDLLRDESYARIAIHDRDYYAAKAIDLRLGAAVTRLRPERNRIELANGTDLAYSSLLLTVGARVRELKFAPVGGAGIRYLRTISDARALRKDLAAGGAESRLVVIGGGYLGLEIAAMASAYFGWQVRVIEQASQLLARALPSEIARHVEALHRQRGVAVSLGVGVVEIVRSAKGSVSAVVTSDGGEVPADLVVVAAGIVANTDLAADAGLSVDDGIVVDAFGRTSGDGIYAAGDVTRHPNEVFDCSWRLESWQNAQNQAIAVGRVICGRGKPYAEVPWFWSDQFDLNIQIVGAPTLASSFGYLGNPAAGIFCVVGLSDGVVVGVAAFNSGREIRFARELIVRRAAVSMSALASTSSLAHLR